jgi:hypothetical protein
MSVPSVLPERWAELSDARLLSERNFGKAPDELESDDNSSNTN